MKKYLVFICIFIIQILVAQENHHFISIQKKALSPVSFQRLQWVHYTPRLRLYLNQLKWQTLLPASFSHFEIYNKKTSQLVGITFVQDTENQGALLHSYTFIHISSQPIEDFVVLASDDPHLSEYSIPTRQEQSAQFAAVPLGDGLPLYAESFDGVCSLQEIHALLQEEAPADSLPDISLLEKIRDSLIKGSHVHNNPKESPPINDQAVLLEEAPADSLPDISFEKTRDALIEDNHAHNDPKESPPINDQAVLLEEAPVDSLLDISFEKTRDALIEDSHAHNDPKESPPINDQAVLLEEAPADSLSDISLEKTDALIEGSHVHNDPKESPPINDQAVLLEEAPADSLPDISLEKTDALIEDSHAHNDPKESPSINDHAVLLEEAPADPIPSGTEGDSHMRVFTPMFIYVLGILYLLITF